MSLLIPLRNHRKLKFFLLFLIYLAKSQEIVQIKDQICTEDGDITNSRVILMSPGFISGALPYVQNSQCSEAGDCQNIPNICKDSSCCIQNSSSTITTFPALPTPSQCGCWDSKRKTCRPIDNFRLDGNICSQQSHFEVISRFELTHVSQNVAKPCLRNSANMNFDVDTEMGYLKMTIATISCVRSQNLRKESDANGDRDVSRTSKGYVSNIVTEAEREAYYLATSGNEKASPSKILLRLKEKSNSRPFPLFSKQQNVADSRTTHYVPNSTIENESEKHNFRCTQNNGQSSASLTSGFLHGAGSGFLNPGLCGNRGNCKVFTPACNKNRCLLSNNKNSSTGVCDCLTDNITSCLSDNKIFRTENTFCTRNGELIDVKISVQIPSTAATNCKDGSASSWQMTAWDLVINTKDNVEIVVKSRECVLSKGLVGGNYFEVEEDVKMEMQLDTFEKTIEKLDKIKRDYDQTKLLGTQ